MDNCQDFQIVNDGNSVFDLSVLSAIGVRSEQQDSFGYNLRCDEGIVVVCDGMGGREAGSVASSVAVKNVLDAYEGNFSDASITELLIDCANETDQKICNLCDENGVKLNSGTTMVAVAIKDYSLCWCSVGDSRAYLARKGEFVQFTQDQNYKTVLDEKLRANLITEDAYAVEMKRGEALISFLGIGNLSLIDYNNLPLQLEKDDKIIIMTDGLYKVLEDEEIARVADNFSNIEDALNALEIKTKKQAKKKNISRDNMTVALIKIR